MKKRSIVLSVLAAFLILSLSVGSAMAYFTTYTKVTGDAPFKAGNTTRIDESYSGGIKSVTITNLSKSKEAVYVRAKVFSVVPTTLSGSGWSNHGEYWYYADAVAPGGKTAVLNVAIDFDNSGFKAKDHVGENVSVIVVYEAIFAPQFYADGKEMVPWDVDWTQKVLLEDAS